MQLRYHHVSVRISPILAAFKFSSTVTVGSKKPFNIEWIIVDTFFHKSTALYACVVVTVLRIQITTTTVC